MVDHFTLTLRAATDADADLLYRLAADLDTWEERGPLAPAPLTRAAWDAAQARRAEDAGDRAVRFVVDVDGQASGSASIFDIDTFARQGEVGMNLVPEARGRGVGAAAVGRLAEFAFVRLDLRRLHLQAIASNVRALRAYARAGFVEEGRQREAAYVRGRHEDVVRMGLLRSEWSAGRAG